MSWKVECDYLTKADWKCLSYLAKEKLRRIPSRVMGVPTGGERWEAIFSEEYSAPGSDVLILDDVLTTGSSMEEMRRRLIADGVPENKITGMAAFSRGKCTEWVKRIWRLDDS